jgi:hypothetical protein
MDKMSIPHCFIARRSDILSDNDPRKYAQKKYRELVINPCIYIILIVDLDHISI